MENTKNVKISLDISPEIRKKLQQKADEMEMSVSGLIRYIIKNYFKEN